MAGVLQTFVKQIFGANKTTQKQVATPVKNASKKTVSTNIVVDRTIPWERTQEEVAREDILLNQIDEFREKAQKLQDLLLSKESKVEELQNIVDEKEGKAKELQDILEERQQRADVITEEMNQQIDKLIERVTVKLSEIEASMSEDLADGRKVNEEQAVQMKESLKALTVQLESMKTEVSDKIHTENVKCYRNVADLLKSLEDKIERVSYVEDKLSSVHKCTITVIVLAIINLLGLVALFINELGMFGALTR